MRPAAEAERTWGREHQERKAAGGWHRRESIGRGQLYALRFRFLERDSLESDLNSSTSSTETEYEFAVTTPLQRKIWVHKLSWGISGRKDPNPTHTLWEQRRVCPWGRPHWHTVALTGVGGEDHVGGSEALDHCCFFPLLQLFSQQLYFISKITFLSLILGLLASYL